MRCRAVHRLRKRLGRRGHFLAIIGIGKTSWGVSFLAAPPATPVIPALTSWAWIWIVCGLATFASAFAQVGRDGFGFAAALVPPSVWAITYLAAALGGHYSRGVWVAIWYLTSHVGVILWAAKVPEHSVPKAPRGRRAEGG
ncbi:hypothetical protein PL81_38680 [Streptomyces sp. RSD-27]|nr:hypothetical protein PL81_38680 [Streptomyces sp. RSD-27]